MPHGWFFQVNVHHGVFFGLGDGRLDDPDALAQGIIELAFDQVHGHEAVVKAVDVDIEAVRKEMIVIGADGIFGDEVAKFIRRADHAVTAAFRCVFGFYGFGFNDAGGADGDSQIAITLEAPVENVVVVADHRSGAQDEHTRSTAGKLMFFKMAPGRIARVAFKETRDLGVDYRETVFFPRQTIEIHCVGGAIDFWTQRFQNVPGSVELARINEDAVGPVQRGIHVRHIELGHGTFVENGAETIAVLDSGEIDDGANARIKAEPESPVLPTNFAALDLKAGTQGLSDPDRRGSGAGSGFQILIIHRSLGNGNDALVDHLQHFFFCGVHSNLQSLDFTRPGEISAMSIGAVGNHDAMAFECGQREVAEWIGETGDGIEVGDAAFLERFNDTRIFFHGFVQFAEFADHDGSLNVLALFPGFEFVAGDVDESFDGYAF